MKTRRGVWRIPGRVFEQPTARPVLIVPLAVATNAGARVVLAAYQTAGTVVCMDSPGGLVTLDLAPQRK